MNLKETLAAKFAEPSQQELPRELEGQPLPQAKQKKLLGYRSKINSLRGYQCGNTILRANELGLYVPKTPEEVEFIQLLIMENVLEPVKE